MKPAVTIADVRAARERIAPFINRTAVMQSEALSAMAGARLFFKCECLQKTGAFKARGAHNAVFSLTDGEAKRGVLTHSSGNHAAALALAARNRGIPAYIVMPTNSAQVKVDSVKRLGGQVTLCEPNLEAREGAAALLRRETGAVLIHPYNDERVIAGQGTAALELLEDVPELDAIVVPVGGGGLLSGTAIAAKAHRLGLAVYGAEPAQADDACRSFRAGRIMPLAPTTTIADGLRSSLGEKTFAIIREQVDDIVTVSEESLIGAMRLAMEILKQVVEPSSAAPVAVVLERKLPVRHARIGIILSGGNVDLEKLPWAAR